MDTEPLSEYEQPLPIRERGSGIVTAHDADAHVTDAAARVRGGVASRCRNVERGTEPLPDYEQPLPIREHDAGCRDGARRQAQDKQKSHFIESDLICKNVYVLAKGKSNF